MPQPPIDPSDGADTIFIGSDSTGANCLDALIDDLAIYDIILTDGEIADLYNSGEVIIANKSLNKAKFGAVSQRKTTTELCSGLWIGCAP